MSVSGRPCAHGRHGNSHHHRTTPALQEEEKPAEKEAFDLKLVSFDDKSKIKVIKEVRTISGLGLKEVRCLVSSVRCFFVFTRRSPRDLVRVRACVYMDGWRDVGGWVGMDGGREGGSMWEGCLYICGRASPAPSIPSRLTTHPESIHPSNDPRRRSWWKGRPRSSRRR